MSNISGFIKSVRDIMREDPGVNGDAQRIEQLSWMLFLKVYDSQEENWKILNSDYVSIIPKECIWAKWGGNFRFTGESLLNFVNNILFPTLKNLEITPDTPINKKIVKYTFTDANNYMKDGVLLRKVLDIINDLDLSDNNTSHAFGEIYEAILKEIQSAGSSGEFYTPRAVTDFMAKMIKPELGERCADFACGTGGFLTSFLKELEKKVKTAEDRDLFGESIFGIEKKQFPYILCVTNMLLHDIEKPEIYHEDSFNKKVLDYTYEDKFDIILMNPPYGGVVGANLKNNFPYEFRSSETADLFMTLIMYRLKEEGRAAVILPDGFLFGNDNAKVAIKRKLLNEFNLHTIIRLPHSVFAPYTSITTNILFFNKEEGTKRVWFYRLDMPSGYKNFSKTKPIELKHFDPVIEWWNNRKEIEDKDGYKAKCYPVSEIVERNYNLDLCGYPHEEEEILTPKEFIERYKEEREELNNNIDSLLARIEKLIGDGNEG